MDIVLTVVSGVKPESRMDANVPILLIMAPIGLLMTLYFGLTARALIWRSVIFSNSYG